jgi:hypothetical protein
MPTRGCSTCSWHSPSYADAPCRERRRIKRWKRSWHLSNERWPASARARSSSRPAVARQLARRTSGTSTAETASYCAVMRPAAGSSRPCTTGSSRPTPRSTRLSRGAGGSPRWPTCTSFGPRTTRSCGRCTGTRPAGATPPSPTSTSTPSAPTDTSSRRDRPSSQRCSGASRWERRRRTRSGARCSPSPRASTSCTDPGPRPATTWSLTPSLPRCNRDPGQPRVTRLPITSSPPTAQCRGKGGPEAHPVGTRSALPAAGAVGEAPVGMGGCCSEVGVRSSCRHAAQSAQSPQMVRKTARIDQLRPTPTNYESAGQDGFSVTAHCAKPPLGRFCKAGVRGSIPLVSTGTTSISPRKLSRRPPFHVERARRPGTSRPGTRTGQVVPRGSVAEWSRD